MPLRVHYFGCFAILFAGGCERDAHLSFDANGVAHGTGEKVYTYKSGAVKLTEDYIDGQVARSRWFKSDGLLIQETDWKNGTGEGIYLREDGSIKCRMRYTNGLAEGAATNYDGAGHATKVMYHHGQPVEPTSASESQPAG